MDELERLLETYQDVDDIVTCQRLAWVLTEYAKTVSSQVETLAAEVQRLCVEAATLKLERDEYRELADSLAYLYNQTVIQQGES